MEKLLDKLHRSRLIPFLLAGGIAAAANFGSRFLFNLWLTYEVSIVLAYLVGMIIAFVLMRGRVFQKGEQKLLPQVVKFSLVNLLSIAQTLLVSMGLNYWLLPWLGITQNPEAIAHFFGVAVPVIVSYFLHRNITFK